MLHNTHTRQINTKRGACIVRPINCNQNSLSKTRPSAFWLLSSRTANLGFSSLFAETANRHFTVIIILPPHGGLFGSIVFRCCNHFCAAAITCSRLAKLVKNNTPTSHMSCGIVLWTARCNCCASATHGIQRIHGCRTDLIKRNASVPPYGISRCRGFHLVHKFVRVECRRDRFASRQMNN